MKIQEVKGLSSEPIVIIQHTSSKTQISNSTWVTRNKATYFWNSHSLLSRGHTCLVLSQREIQWKWNACWNQCNHGNQHKTKSNIMQNKMWTASHNENLLHVAKATNRDLTSPMTVLPANLVFAHYSRNSVLLIKVEDLIMWSPEPPSEHYCGKCTTSRSHKGLSPCDFDLIPKLKEPLRGIRFRTVPEFLQAVDRSIRTINTTDAAEGILRLPHCWQRVVHNAGDYIEGQ